MSRAGPGLGLHKGRICLLVNPASVISPLTIQATPPPPHQATWATFIPAPLQGPYCHLLPATQSGPVLCPSGTPAPDRLC